MKGGVIEGRRGVDVAGEGGEMIGSSTPTTDSSYLKVLSIAISFSSLVDTKVFECPLSLSALLPL